MERKIGLQANELADPPRRAAERILDAAAEVFYREGIRAVGVEEVVQKAGVTKPTLYRSFASKDELAAAYLRRYDERFWRRFDEAVEAHPGDPKAQILFFLAGTAARDSRPASRGCGLTNAAVEFPEETIARTVCEANKRELRRRFREKAAEMGAGDPELLGDGLMMLFEGANATAHTFQADRPGASIVPVAKLLIEAGLASSGRGG